MNSTLAAVPRWLVVVSGALSLLGLAGLVLTLALGFETPNTAMLVLSALLVFASPLAALWHFIATRTLTTAEKRMWLRELAGADAFSAISEYMRSQDLAASARRRAGTRRKEVGGRR